MSSFDQFSLNKKLLNAIQKKGFETPTEIQRDVIPFILEGKDLIGKAKTGSGKTAAFSIPSIQLLIDDPQKMILVITPTRELALQVTGELKSFAKDFSIEPLAIFGGESIKKQIDSFRKDPRIVVATPGRLLDLLSSNKLKNFAPQTVILDEADEMLKMGFIDDVETIFTYIPEEHQTLLFSATLSPAIQKIAKKFLKEPVFVEPAIHEESHSDISHVHYLVPDRSKRSALLQLLFFHNPEKAIIFCNTKKEVEELSSSLLKSGHSAFSLQGDLNQNERKRAIEKFRKEKRAYLIATDVAARGIDIDDISHVINYDLPYEKDSYTHRIGRTGRIGRKGIAMNLVTPRQKGFLKALHPKQKITLATLPTLEEIQEKQNEEFFTKLSSEKAGKQSQRLFAKLSSEFTPEELSLRLLSLLWKQETSAIEVVASPSLKDSKRERFRDEGSFQNRGRKKGFKGRSFPPKRGHKKSAPRGKRARFSK